MCATLLPTGGEGETEGDSSGEACIEKAALQHPVHVKQAPPRFLPVGVVKSTLSVCVLELRICMCVRVFCYYCQGERQKKIRFSSCSFMTPEQVYEIRQRKLS